MLGRAHRRYHLHQEAVWIEAVDAQIGGRRLDGEMHACPACGTHDLEALVTGEMYDVKVRARDFREIERGLNGERLCNRRVCVLPIFQRPFGLTPFQL